MAIAFDAATSSLVASASSLTFSHVAGSGSDQVAIVQFGLWVIGSRSVTSVTYGGVGMTQVVTTTTTPSATIYTFQYYLSGVSSGSNQVIITLDSGFTAISAAAITLNGASQSLPTNTVVIDTPFASSSFSTNFTTTNNNSFVLEHVFPAQTDHNNINPQDGQVKRWGENAGGTSTSAGYTRLQVTAGLFNSAYTHDNANGTVASVFELQETGGAVAGANNAVMFGFNF